jgi:hypothetical protein
VHDKEKVAIAAEPYDTKEKASLFRVDYLAHGMMPIRLIVTNDGDRPISLRDARILFLTAAGDKIQAAEPEDVERLMTRKEREGGKIPCPGIAGRSAPSPRPATKRSSRTLTSLSTRRWLWSRTPRGPGSSGTTCRTWTIRCAGAKLHLHKLRDADGQELFYFEIPFDNYLKSKSAQMN